MEDRSESPNGAPVEDSGAPASGSKRLQSTIVFPYNSLAEAELIAETLLRQWGGSASQDQIAGGLHTTPRSGTFRNKLGAARIFGAVTVSRGNVKLTELGHRLVDPQTQKEARVEAFLAVPLYKAVYDAYEGKSLPPDTGLEQKIAELGVSPKQSEKARQAMKSSAKRAGFFDTNRSRLIRPNGSGSYGAQAHPDDGQQETPIQQPTPTGAPLSDLWLTLLNEGAEWSADKTQDFVNAARKLREVMARES